MRVGSTSLIAAALALGCVAIPVASLSAQTAKPTPAQKAAAKQKAAEQKKAAKLNAAKAKEAAKKPKPVLAIDPPKPPVPAEFLIDKRYVAIGSSFAAGPQLPPVKPSWPSRCGQSFNNYPTLLADRFGLELIDRSCSGAVTNNVLGPWNEVPPQIASVTPETRLVTITIGGNDLSYIGNLFSATCAFNAKLAAPGTKTHACGAVRVPTEADYVRDEAQMNEIARRIKATAPKARIVFVQYLTPLPPSGKLCAVTPVSETDAAIVREIGRRLSEITARVAAANGTLIVDMDKASVTRTPCDKEPWMIGSPQGYDGSQGLQWHLNKAGMQATADAIAAALIKDGVRPAKSEVKAEASANPAGRPATIPAPNAPAPAVPVPRPTEGTRR